MHESGEDCCDYEQMGKRGSANDYSFSVRIRSAVPHKAPLSSIERTTAADNIRAEKKWKL